MKRSIGVFDSGMGGVSTLIELKKVLPNEDFIYYGDSGNAPYGTRSNEEVLQLSLNVVEKLIEKNVKAIVIACNTATSVAVKEIRRRYKDLIVVGIEPALKVGIDMGAKNIMLMATNATLRGEKLNTLKSNYAQSCNVIGVPCPELVEIAENGLLKDANLCKEQLDEYLKNYENNSLDAIVLGCTHFLFYKEYIRELVGERCIIVDGNNGTARQLKKQLKNYNLLNSTSEMGCIEFFNSQKPNPDEINKLELSKEIFNMFS